MRKSIIMPLVESSGCFELYQLERTPGRDYILLSMQDGQQIRLTANDLEIVVSCLNSWRRTNFQESSVRSKPDGKSDKESSG